MPASTATPLRRSPRLLAREAAAAAAAADALKAKLAASNMTMEEYVEVENNKSKIFEEFDSVLGHHITNGTQMLMTCRLILKLKNQYRLNIIRSPPLRRTMLDRIAFYLNDFSNTQLYPAEYGALVEAEKDLLKTYESIETHRLYVK